jgi:hypothetical protein
MINDKMVEKALWTIRKFHSDEHFEQWKEAGEPERDHEFAPFEISPFEGNILLNEGIAELDALLTGDAATAYSNANAYLGVGSDATAENATQTGLIDGTPTHKPMEATYPLFAAQITTWRAVFGSGDANEAWEEFTVVNAATDAGDNLNRKTSSQGTKAAGQTWTLDLAITWS